MNRLAAVVPAAGLSSRMGAFKPLLPMGACSVLAAAVGCLRRAGVDDVFVVTGRRGEDVAREARAAGARPVHNPDFALGMFSSVLRGFAAVEAAQQDGADYLGVLLLPGDVPLVGPDTVARLGQGFLAALPAVLYPRFLGERGHPPVIHTDLMPAIRTHNGVGGLRAVLAAAEDRAADLDVADQGVVHDLDMPEDYDLARALLDLEYPTEAECRQLDVLYDVPEDVAVHCEAVAQVAGALCAAWNAARPDAPLDQGLAVAAARIHDLAKGLRGHEAEGAARLCEHGFPAAARLVEGHSDTAWSAGDPVTEREVVFLADKLVRGAAAVPLAGRYAAKLDAYGADPDARRAIQGRLERARAVLRAMDEATGASMERLAREALS